MRLLSTTSSKYLANQSTLVLILINLSTLVFALHNGWSAFELMFLYWLETAIIGAFSIVKMLHRGGIMSLFLIAFFCVHFGMFMFGHITFIFALFGPDGGAGDPFSGSFWNDTLLPNVQYVFIPFLGLAASHLFSFFYNYIGKQEYKTKNVMYFFAYPYPRIVVMHLTILLGGFVAQFVPGFALILLALLKTTIDSFSHTKIHAPSRA